MSKKDWHIVELGEDELPEEEQPTLRDYNGKGRERHILLPVSFLAGFTNECKLTVGGPDSVRVYGPDALNVTSSYGYDNLDDWRCWQTSEKLPVLRKQLQAAIDWWHAHNDSDTNEIDALLAEATALTLQTNGQGDTHMSAKKLEPVTKNADILWENRRSIALPGAPSWPTGDMPPEEAARLLLDKAKEDNEEVEINETMADCFPWDGAVQFSRAMAVLHGWGRVKATEIQTMFGTKKIPPKSISVEVAPGVFEEVLWGEFSVPGIKGELNCGVNMVGERMVFCLRGTVIKRDLPRIRALADMTRQLLRESSIYKGKAIQLVINTRSKKIDWMEQPRFLNPPVTMKDLIYSQEIMDQIDTHLITPIRKREVLEQIGCPFGGAVLLSGTYGVGKTVLAAAMANECVDAEVTYIDVQTLEAVQEVLVAARPLGPCLVFVEDIDRISEDAQRNDATQDIMNTLASVSSKGAQVMACFSTNKPGAIHPALIQRMNAVVVISPPEPLEVERLIRLYGRSLVDPQEDLGEASEYLAGKVPRTIEQIVQASKKYSVSRNGVNDLSELRIIGRDLIGAARQKEYQLQLESRTDERTLTPAEQIGAAMASLINNKVEDATTDIRDMVGDIHKKVC